MSDNVVARPGGSDAYGGPEMVQLLTPEGERVDHPEYSRYLDGLTDEDLRGFYRDMFLIRRVDTEGTALQRQGELGLWVSLLGQEAAQIGVGRAMRKQDYAFPGYREHGVGWCRGVKPLQVMSQFRGVDQGGWDPNEVGMQLYTIVIGNQVLMGTGYAMGITLDGDVGTGDPDRDAAVVAFFGDGATAQGDVNESFVFAGVNNAPIVFFCQNNQWAISVPSTVQTRVPLAKRAEGYGFPGVRVDGNDVLAVEAVTRWALEHARTGRGPVLIEAYTYRMSAHTTADDPTKYRLSGDEQEWRTRDPLARLETYLRSAGLADDAFFEGLADEARVMASDLRAAVLSMTVPDLESRFAAVYAEPHPLVQEELRFFQQYESGFADEGKHA